MDKATLWPYVIGVTLASRSSHQSQVPKFGTWRCLMAKQAAGISQQAAQAPLKYRFHFHIYSYKAGDLLRTDEILEVAFEIPL